MHRLDSGDAQVLKNVIDIENVKLHKVSQEAGNSDRNSSRNTGDRQL